MAPPDEAAEDNARRKAGKKAHMPETRQCLLFARDNLPRDVYEVFVKHMTEFWKRCADPDGEIRSICAETCIETAMKLFQGCAPVRQGFLNFTQGRSLLDGDVKDHIVQSPLDFLRKVKECRDINKHDHATILQTLIRFSRMTMTSGEVSNIVKGCLRNSPELLEEFANHYLLPDLKGLLTDEKSCRNPKTGRVGKATLRFTPDANQSLDSTQLKATNTRKEDSEESLLAEEDGKDKVQPLPDWITCRLEDTLPPEVNPKNFKRCTPSYYRLPKNCRTLQSSYRTKLGKTVLNDALVSPSSVESLQKTQNDYEINLIKCEDQMFESDVLLQRFRATADFIANLQDRVGSSLRINELITPLHKRCIEKLYNDDPELYDVLESQITSSTLSILLSRLNQRVQNLSEARLCLLKILPPVIAENYYRSLDHNGPSFKQLDAKRMVHKALLAEAKEIQKSRLNAVDEYANAEIHKDICRIISSVRSSEEKLMMTWRKIVHPFLSANCLQSYLDETVAPSEACEQCGISKDFLSSICDALASNKLPLSPKEGSSSANGFGVEIEEGEFVPNLQTINLDSMLGPGKEQERASRDVAASGGHPGNEPEKKNEPRELSKKATKLRGVKGGTCCSLVVLRRLYQILYKRLQTARDLCTGDLYTEFKDQLCRFLDRSIDNCKFEDFCLKFLGPKSFELFTLDRVINKVIKQLCIISSSDLLINFLGKLGRPIQPKHLSQHQNVILQSLYSLRPRKDVSQIGQNLDILFGAEAVLLTTSSAHLNPALFIRPSIGLHDREEQNGKLPLHFERRKKRKVENVASSSSLPKEGIQTRS